MSRRSLFASNTATATRALVAALLLLCVLNYSNYVLHQSQHTVALHLGSEEPPWVARDRSRAATGSATRRRLAGEVWAGFAPPRLIEQRSALLGLLSADDKKALASLCGRCLLHQLKLFAPQGNAHKASNGGGSWISHRVKGCSWLFAWVVASLLTVVVWNSFCAGVCCNRGHHRKLDQRFSGAVGCHHAPDGEVACAATVGGGRSAHSGGHTQAGTEVHNFAELRQCKNQGMHACPASSPQFIAVLCRRFLSCKTHGRTHLILSGKWVNA